MTRFRKHLEVALDDICHQGCQHVRECILKIQNNESIIELKTIDDEGQQIIVAELISIMQVYDMQNNGL